MPSPRTRGYLAPILLAAMLVCVSFEGASAGRIGSFTGKVSNFLRGNSNQFDTLPEASGAVNSEQQQLQPKRKTFWPWQRQPAPVQEEQLAHPQEPSAEDLAYGSQVLKMQAGRSTSQVQGSQIPGEVSSEAGYTGMYGHGATTVTREDITPKNGIYGVAYTPGAGEPTGIDAGLVGGSQAATDYVNHLNALAGVTAGQGAGPAPSANARDGVPEQGVSQPSDLSAFQKKVVATLLGPPTAKPGEPGCNLAVEDGQESQLKKRVALLTKQAQTIDTDRRNKFVQKLNAARYAEKAREECTQAILVNGACNRVAAIDFVTRRKKAALGMKSKYDKTPDRDRDRKGGLRVKLEEQNSAYAAAVSCVKQVMGFDPIAAGA